MLWKMFHSLSPPWETLSKNNDDHITWQQKQLQSLHVTQQVRLAKALTVRLFLYPIIFFFCCKHTTQIVLCKTGAVWQKNIFQKMCQKTNWVAALNIVVFFFFLLLDSSRCWMTVFSSFLINKKGRTERSS